MSSPDQIDIVPERVFPLVVRAAWSVRLGHAAADGLLSLALNGVVVACLIHIGWPVAEPFAAPQSISVELVDHMPGQERSGDKATDTGSGSRAKEEPRPAPPQPAPEQTTPQSQSALPLDEPKPSSRPSDDREPQVSQAPESPRAATPAPLEHQNNDPTPRLVEAPAEPQQGSKQVDQNVAAPAPPAADGSRPGPPAPAPEPPRVLSSEAGADEAPQAATEPGTKPPEPTTKPPEPTAEEKRQAETTARLAAALPFSPTVMSGAFQAPLSAAEANSAEAYRGTVYAAFRKVAAQLSQGKHLSGQAVVAFTIDDKGGLVHLGVAVPSGNAEIDEIVLESIRRSAPFPPPPAGAPRSFSTALGFGIGQ